MVCHHGIDRFQGWLVVRGGPKATRCRRKTWDEVCKVAVFFSRGPDYQRHFRWSVVASLVETRNSGRESSNYIQREQRYRRRYSQNAQSVGKTR